MPSCAHTTSRCVAPMWRVVDEGGQLLRLLHFPHLMHLCVCLHLCLCLCACAYIAAGNACIAAAV